MRIDVSDIRTRTRGHGYLVVVDGRPVGVTMVEGAGWAWWRVATDDGNEGHAETFAAAVLALAADAGAVALGPRLGGLLAS